MARVKITALPETSSLKGTDLITAVADSTNYKVQVQNLGANLSVASSSYSVSGSYALSSSYAANGGVTSIVAGAGISVSSATGNVTITNTGGGGGALTFADEGTAQGTATFVDFIGAGVTLSVASNTASVTIAGVGGTTFPYTGSAIISGSLIVTGSVSSTQGFTGSLNGTASWASNSVTASFVTGSNVWGPFGSNSVISASYATSASNSLTSSYTATASYVVGVQGSVIGGNGTTNYVAKFTPNGTTLGNSVAYDDGTNLGIGTTSPKKKLEVLGDVLVTGSLVVSGANGAGVFSQGATIVDYINGVSNSGSYMVWRAPFSCSVVALYGYREGGGSAQVNAVRSGSSGFAFLTGSNITLTGQNIWVAANSITGSASNFNAGDTLKVIMSASSANNQIAVQVDFIKKF